MGKRLDVAQVRDVAEAERQTIKRLSEWTIKD